MIDKSLKYFLWFFGIVAVLVIILGDRAEATTQDCTNVTLLNQAELEDCKLQTEARMEERSLDFNEVASQTATYRELVAAGEAEMIALNSANNSDRVRIRIINRMLASFQYPQ